jgi:hypothetical protein
MKKMNMVNYAVGAINGIDQSVVGAYAIYNGPACIYIGVGNIRYSLLNHWNGNTPCLDDKSPTHFLWWTGEDAVEHADQLIRENDPICNRAAS